MVRLARFLPAYLPDRTAGAYKYASMLLVISLHAVMTRSASIVSLSGPVRPALFLAPLEAA
jgi:hypothetical protein